MSAVVRPKRWASAGRTRNVSDGPGDDQAVLGVRDVRDLIDLRLDRRRGLLQEIQIGGEDLDFDGLGRADQIADQIAEHAVKVHVDLRLDVLESVRAVRP